jgi:hypothetical protein
MPETVPTTAGYQEAEGGGAADQAQEKAKEVASQAQDKAREAAGQARGRVREQVDQRSTQLGRQVGENAGDARSIAEDLRKQGKDTPARYVEQAADRAERLGGYLEQSDADRILGDVEDFGRRNPWAIAAGGLLIGFAASRMLKASSSDRYRSSQSNGRRLTAAGQEGIDNGAPGGAHGTRPSQFEPHS